MAKARKATVRNAVLRIAVVYLNCPTPGCGGGFESSEGSFMLDQTTFDHEVGDVINCYECGGAMRVPAKMRGIW